MEYNKRVQKRITYRFDRKLTKEIAIAKHVITERLTSEIADFDQQE